MSHACTMQRATALRVYVCLHSAHHSVSWSTHTRWELVVCVTDRLVGARTRRRNHTHSHSVRSVGTVLYDVLYSSVLSVWLAPQLIARLAPSVFLFCVGFVRPCPLSNHTHRCPITNATKRQLYLIEDPRALSRNRRNHGAKVETSTNTPSSCAKRRILVSPSPPSCV